jgi:hypothetical protein
VFAKAKDDAKERSVSEGMEIVVEFKRRMEVYSGETKTLRNRERELIALGETIHPLSLLLG